MSYNIDTFKVKKLDDLQIPVDSLFEHERKDWHPKKKIGETDDTFIRFEWNYSVYIEGPVIDGYVHVKKIDWSDECSGTAMDWIFEPALQQSKGNLIASCVWEGGDTINQLVVADGQVSWIAIDI